MKFLCLKFMLLLFEQDNVEICFRIIPDAAKSKVLNLKGMLLFLERHCSNVKKPARFANQQCLVVSVAKNSFKLAKSIQALHFKAKKA